MDGGTSFAEILIYRSTSAGTRRQYAPSAVVDKGGVIHAVWYGLTPSNPTREHYGG